MHVYIDGCVHFCKFPRKICPLFTQIFGAINSCKYFFNALRLQFLLVHGMYKYIWLWKNKYWYFYKLPNCDVYFTEDVALNFMWNCALQNYNFFILTIKFYVSIRLALGIFSKAAVCSKVFFSHVQNCQFHLNVVECRFTVYLLENVFSFAEKYVQNAKNLSLSMKPIFTVFLAKSSWNGQSLNQMSSK